MTILGKAWRGLPDAVRREVGLRPLRRALTSRYAIARHNSRLSAGAATLNFFPGRPLPRAQLAAILELIGVGIGSDLDRGPQIAWQRDTWLRPAEQAQLASYAINRACIDVSKSRVDAAWADIAGYSLSVDPLVTGGLIVVKSEKNSRHDWRPITGPLQRRKPGVVYERFIDATAGDEFVQSRPVIMRGHMPTVFALVYPRQHWRAEARTLASRAGDFYSATEVEQILKFAAAIGLEYGELDVVRDNATGQLFVIDANPTPVRAHRITPRDEAATLRQMADAFAEIFAADLAR